VVGGLFLPNIRRFKGETGAWLVKSQIAQGVNRRTLRSKQAGGSETVVAESRRVGDGVADNHVVMQLDVEGSRRLAKPAGELLILARWCRITRWVIVDTDDGGGP